MALKEGGFSADLWDEWSRSDGDSRYRPGICYAKWETFMDHQITIGTLIMMAKEHGFTENSADYGRELVDGEKIYLDDYYKVVDNNFIDSKEIPVPKNWSPVDDAYRFISTLFKPNEHVGYCTKAYQDSDGKWHPQTRVSDRTAGRLLEELEKAKSVEDVFYDYNHDAGVWVIFNPLDGAGTKKANITDYRYTLVESDSQNIEKQYALMTELQLPIATLVYSGNKSLHAIVKVDAPNQSEYTKRVQFLFDVCKKNGLEMDAATKDVNRLSRMPGFIRGDNRQYLIDTNIGQQTWQDWVDYIESVNDELPDPVNFSEIWNNPPQLAPELIKGILRKGHKMLLSGGSKTGKSMLMIQLAVAVASGGEWLGRRCEKGKVLYVNLEIDKDSFGNRLLNVCGARGTDLSMIGDNLDVWSLRGYSLPLDKLVPRLIRRCKDKAYTAVIIDPIYKVMMGDENKAGDMAQFCNQFDKIAAALGCSVIYVHHFSKGTQGQKASIDRASGSGVFARDPDAILTITKLETRGLKDFDPAEGIPVRLEANLREFEAPDPVDSYFRYPVHVLDTDRKLAEAKTEGEEEIRGGMSKDERLERNCIAVGLAFENLAEWNEETQRRECFQTDLLEEYNRQTDAPITKQTLQNWLKKGYTQGYTDLIIDPRNKRKNRKQGTRGIVYEASDEGDENGCN